MTDTLHDEFELVPGSSAPATRLREPGEVVDFCRSCGKKECPKVVVTADGGLDVTDSELPGVVIHFGPDEHELLAKWLSGR